MKNGNGNAEPCWHSCRNGFRPIGCIVVDFMDDLAKRSTVEGVPAVEVGWGPNFKPERMRL